MNKTIFEYRNYKDFVRNWVLSRPKKGHGQYLMIAKFLNTSSVSVSQIFKGNRDLTDEQAFLLCEFLGLSNLESDYFSLLVQLERAGSAKLKAHLQTKLEAIRDKSKELNNILSSDVELDEKVEALFYSRWEYTALSLLVDIPGLNSVESLADHMQIPRWQVKKIVDFLLRYQLIVSDGGQLKMGPQYTRLDTSSMLTERHRVNWRIKAIEHSGDLEPEELFYTSPMVLSKEAMGEIRKKLAEVIADALKVLGPSKSEELACLNIDFFKVHPSGLRRQT